jgi:O-succinylbenzoate synthase
MVLRSHLLPALFSAGQVGAAQAGAAMAEVKGHPMAKAAVEIALLDAELRAESRSLSEFLGGSRRLVEAGVAVGLLSSLDDLVETVGARLSEGYRRIKLKIEPGWDLEPVRAVREAFGDITLQVDANGSYSREDATHLSRLDPYGLILIEQPLEDDDLVGSAELAKMIRTPVCLDESITSARAAELAISVGACSVVNVKAGRVGGYIEARRVHDVCTDSGIPVWCGGMYETGIGRAANAALASLPGFTLPGDLSASERYFVEDLTEPFVLEGGCLRVPDGPGIGRSPRPEALSAHTRSAAYYPWP